MNGLATPISVLLVDDHPIFLEGIRSLIEATNDIRVAGQEMSGLPALKLASEKRPDVAIVDISLPDISGIVLAQRLLAEVPAIRLIMLSWHEERAYVQRALESGVRGYVLKRSAAENILHAIRAVVHEGVYLDPMVAGRFLLARARGQQHGETGMQGRSGPPLTGREAEVLRLIARGYTSKEIAGQLDVTAKSVETYKARACEKLDLKMRTQIVRYAVTQGWLANI